MSRNFGEFGDHECMHAVRETANLKYGPVNANVNARYERKVRMKLRKTRARAFFFRKIVLFFKILHVARDFESFDNR